MDLLISGVQCRVVLYRYISIKMEMVMMDASIISYSLNSLYI